MPAQRPSDFPHSSTTRALSPYSREDVPTSANSKARKRGKKLPEATCTAEPPSLQPTPPPSPRKPRTPRKSPNKNSPATTSTSSPTSSTCLLSQAEATSKKWYRQPKTTSQYDGYIKNGRLWLQSFSTCEHEEVEVPDGDPSLGREKFVDAFDKLSEYTAVALLLYTVYKCDEQGNGFATAEGVRAAFKQHFERALGCQGNTWSLNSTTGKWEGNPVFYPEYKVYYESLKRRQLKTGILHQATPMLPKDLKIILDYFSTPEASSRFSQTKILFFSAFATTAFNLWTRCDELIHLPAKDMLFIDSNSSDEESHIRFDLIFRKTNQNSSICHRLQVPPQPECAEIDAYQHMKAWLVHLESQMGRKVQGQDFIFPAIASTGMLKIGESMPAASIDRLLADVVEASGLLKGRQAKFSTHCFRRGGAQYRFMWAKHKWSLKAVKWWGGWSSGDDINTIMRYLLDELVVYEETFEDMLMKNRVTNRQETFMGEPEALSEAAVTKMDLDRLCEKVAELIGQSHVRGTCATNIVPGPINDDPSHRLPGTPQPLSSTPQPPRSISEPTSPSSTASAGALITPLKQCIRQLETIVEDRSTQHSPVDAGEDSLLRSVLAAKECLDKTIEECEKRGVQVEDLPDRNLPDLLTRSSPPPTLSTKDDISKFLIAKLGRIPTTRTFKDVTKFWEDGSPQSGLGVALKDWKTRITDFGYALTDLHSSEAVKYSNIQQVYTEYEKQYSGNLEQFTAAYPDISLGYGKLRRAILSVRVGRGESRRRKSKKKDGASDL
ncbi:hypothetical protein BV25DRAFT_1921184 [Artomyces pyxidatus]|uniref:Uncharacterized protein n=1 Tax=Artomyces pyxidatus TaxID=48021 RepID=A0ACB8SI19_9AGAM|nr:hypothetical protein BV25DRAFT_1921184 [Artomyces pyxidatus]